MSNIDVVIVHYPSADDLVRCLDFLATAGSQLSSVTIVNNDSPHGVPEALSSFLDVDVINHEKNVGFARAANRGAKAGSAPLVLFLNPDVLLPSATLSALAATLETDHVAATGPRLLLPDGRPQVGVAGYFPTCRAVVTHALQVPEWVPGNWSKKPLFLRQPKSAQPSNNGPHSRNVDWVSGACLVVQRDAFEAVGGFDKRFFMYGEDIDLCFRLQQQGWNVRYCPGACAYHSHPIFDGPAVARAPSAEWLEGLDRYYRLHSPRTRRLLHAILAAGFSLRACAYALRLASPRSPAEGAVRRVAHYARRAAELAIRR